MRGRLVLTCTLETLYFKYDFKMLFRRRRRTQPHNYGNYCVLEMCTIVILNCDHSIVIIIVYYTTITYILKYSKGQGSSTECVDKYVCLRTVI